MTTSTTSPTTQGGESVPEPQWSSTTTSIGRDNAKDLLSSGGWTLSRTRDGLEREFVFRGFAKAMTFMNQVADECKVRNHHPEWANVYNTVRIRWTTHNPKGLSDKDVEMARFCDMKAAEVDVKEVSSSSAGWKAGDGGNILENMMPAGSDCGPCGGKKK